MNLLFSCTLWVMCLFVSSVTVGLAVPATAVAEEREKSRPGSEESRQENSRAIQKYDAGFRFGLSDGRNEVDFTNYEFFFYWYPPLAWQHKSGWIFATRLDFTGAALQSSGTTGFLGSIGPSVAVRKTGWPVAIDMGISPAFLSEDRYGVEDLSGHLQFLTHGGITLLPVRRLGIGYEFQHVSNADIQQPNPGLNMHNIKISYRFW